MPYIRRNHATVSHLHPSSLPAFKKKTRVLAVSSLLSLLQNVFQHSIPAKVNGDRREGGGGKERGEILHPMQLLPPRI